MLILPRNFSVQVRNMVNLNAFVLKFLNNIFSDIGLLKKGTKK